MSSDGLDNFPQSDAVLKRHVKQLEKTKINMSRNLKKSNESLSKLTKLANQMLIHVSPAQENLRADSRLAIEEAENHLRDQRYVF